MSGEAGGNTTSLPSSRLLLSESFFIGVFVYRCDRAGSIPASWTPASPVIMTGNKTLDRKMTDGINN